MSLFGVTPSIDEVDHRPVPEGAEIEQTIQNIFESLSSLMTATQLESDLEEVLWNMTNVFHKRLQNSQKRIDDNDAQLRDMIEAQDGSEIKSHELERLQTKSANLWERTGAYEMIRNVAVEYFRAQSGSTWLPRSGSRVTNKATTASVIDSKAYLMAKRRKENETLCPEGTRIAFTGGDYQNVDVVWSALDASHRKYPDMILLHGGGNGAELIASKWADARNVTQVIFKPDWKADRRAAPFKRNDKLLDTMPQGIIATPGTGITENLVDKAKKLGIRVMRIGD